MKKSFFIIVFVLTLAFSYIGCYAQQQKSLTTKEIIQLCDKATKLMKEEQYEKSLIESRLALRFAITTKNNELIAKIYNVIGANFDGLSESDKAFFYYNKGLTYAKKTPNDELKNWLYNNLGNIYCFDKKQYKTGIYYYKKSLAYSKKTKNTEQVLFTKLNITWAYFDIGQYESGYPYLKFINEKYHQKSDESTVVALNMLNGMYYNYKNDIKKATFFFEKAIHLGNNGEEKSDLSFTHHEYSKFLFKNGFYKKAYENLIAFNTITTELNNEEKIKKAKVAGINLELDEYKREIEKIETEYKTKEEILLREQSMNKKIVVVIFSLFIASIILFYFFFQNSRLKQKNRLNSIRSKIQQNVINASITGQEMERKKIATFLHDNISALLSSAGLHLNVFTLKNQTPSEEISKTIAILGEAHDKVRDLSHELLPTLLARFGLFYALQDLCEKNSNSSISFEYKSTIDTKKRYHEEFEMKIYFIITELLNNIIKHSKASVAKVIIEEYGNVIQIQVHDNGKGFDTNKFNIIEGFGLNQIRARIYAMKGDLKVNSKIESGTVIAFDVPVSNK
jgi:two-component system, NarL family, sensor kinase